jgi:pimeloyl-ACP methyl ester carboxylesterase
MNMKTIIALLIGMLTVSGTRIPAEAAEDQVHAQVEHHYVENDGVKIHYVTIGEGAPLVMIHGFPDFWYTWRHQMAALKDQFQIIAIDQRGYNRSDKPSGVDHYNIDLLVEDVAAVLADVGRVRATIVGHDWGGMVAWSFAMSKPEMTERLIVLNLPHPRGLMRELARNGEQTKNSAYARHFQTKDAHKELTAEGLAGWVSDDEARERYVEAFGRSDFEAMLNYYKANYPRPPYKEATDPVVKVQCPTLVIHGLQDTYLLSDALNNTWDWIANDLTLVTIPEAAHFVQHDAANKVSQTMRMWLGR